MKTGNTRAGSRHVTHRLIASMEPGHEDREYHSPRAGRLQGRLASMEPGHEDREYRSGCWRWHLVWRASMEPGHEDREYLAVLADAASIHEPPQWSPAMKTGNTDGIARP